MKWDDDDVYVIGGLVDLDIRSNASLGTVLELVSKELNHLAAILHVYEVKINVLFSKRKWKYFYTFNHFYREKSSKRAK